MAKAKAGSVDHYIAAQPEGVQALLQRVRGAIRKALPGADEVISYNIPSYKVAGRTVLYFAAWKQHYSLYPAGARLVAAFKDDLAAYEIHNSTIRLPYASQPPVALIGRIAKFQLHETTAARPRGTRLPLR